MKKNLFPIICLCLGLQLFVFSVDGGEYRTWTSQDGRQIEAHLTAKSTDQFTIVMRDGRSFSLPLSAVSEADQAYVAEWEFPFRAASPEESTVIIRAGEGAGSGFLCYIDGAVYLVTNQHVIAGANPSEIRFQTAGGKSFERGNLEISHTQDLARFLVPETYGLALSEQVSFSGDVVAFGNSMGTGVITRERGEIKGMGSGMVEVTAQIVPGNSGGPVVGEDGKVVGVSTLVISGTENWVTEGSRYAEARRYATVLRNGMEWEPIAWDDFYRYTRSFAEEEQKLDDTIIVASSILQSPIDGLSLSSSDFSGTLREVLEQHQEDIRFLENLRARGLRSANQIHTINRSTLSRHQSKMKALADNLALNNRTRSEWDSNLGFPYWQEQVKNHVRHREYVRKRLGEEAERDRTFFYLR